jgi:hypothetical protein
MRIPIINLSRSLSLALALALSLSLSLSRSRSFLALSLSLSFSLYDTFVPTDLPKDLSPYGARGPFHNDTAYLIPINNIYSTMSATESLLNFFSKTWGASRGSVWFSRDKLIVDRPYSPPFRFVCQVGEVGRRDKVWRRRDEGIGDEE